MNTFRYVLSIAILAMFCVGGLHAQAIEPVGGPYTVDTNTVVLFHFDGDVRNAAAAVGKTDTAFVKHGTNIAAKIYFIPNTGLPGMGQCIRLDNGAITDSSYLTLADTAALDMTGDWTMEAWVNIFTFGATSSDYRWVPRFIMKPGEDVFWHPNYWNEMWGDSRSYQTGFYTPNDEFISNTSENNMFTPGSWVHMTFIRDTKRGFIAQLIHDQNKKLISFTTRGFNPATQIPKTNINPLHSGWSGALINAVPSTDSWLDGFIDELRISKVVRNFAGPPILTDVTVLPNQSTTVGSYPVTAKAQPFNAGGSIVKVTLYYYTTKWDSVAMTAGTPPNYSASIPQQPFGTNIKYYVAAVDNNGLRKIDPRDAELATNPVYNSFWIYQPNVQTFAMTFEEGPGKVPLDHSPNPNIKIYTFNNVQYSSDRMEGNYSLWLQHSTPPTVVPADSNWVEAESPFLAAEEFCVDMWLNSDSNAHATRIFHYPMAVNDWNNNNYEISIRNNASGKPAITGRYYNGSALVVSQDTNEMALHKWYHVIYERNKSNRTVAIVIRDQNDALLFKTSKVDSASPVMGSSVSPARLRVGRGYTDITDWWFIPAFVGKLDNIQIYNYPKAGITVGVNENPQGLPGTFELSQNYPNPFNPSTRIQFTIPKAGHVDLVVYDLLGRKVKTLVNDDRHVGQHTVTWNGTDDQGFSVSSGVYFYRLAAGDLAKVQKMMLMK